MPDNVFASVLCMSITASVAVIFIILVRFLSGNRIPGIFRYSIWAIVLVRLIFPFSFSTVFSIFNIVPVPETAVIQGINNNQIHNDIPKSPVYSSGTHDKTYGGLLEENSNDTVASASMEDKAATVFSMEMPENIVPWVWLAGVLGLFLTGTFYYIRTYNRLKEAVIYKDSGLISVCREKLKLKRNVKVFTSDRINTPVVCGLIRPNIILPLSLIKDYDENELIYILTHELVHIKRLDYIIKPLSVIALTIHWFNPLIWIAFILSQKDMEISCDEKVISVYENDIRQAYASSLVKLAVKHNILLNGGLLAFGESNIKSRIKGIMKFKKTGLILGIAATAILIVAGGVLLTDAQNGKTDEKVYNTNTEIGDKIGKSEFATPTETFDESKIREDYLETVVINDCIIKDRPGDNYETVGELKYGDIIFTNAKYNDWVRCIPKGSFDKECWIKSENLIDERKHKDYNLGIITAQEVTVGQVALKKGNLVQVLIKEKDRSCVTIRVIDINGGKTAWINNSDYTAPGPGVYHNQAYLKAGTAIYKEPSTKSRFLDNNDYQPLNYELFVNIDKEQDEWLMVSTYGPIMGWVQKEDVFIPESGMQPLPKEDSKNASTGKIEFEEAFNGNLISPTVSKDIKGKLLQSIASMKKTEPGVGLWRVVYCNGDKIILDNYAYIVACDITEKNKGIYSIIDLRNLKVGSYQGSQIYMVHSSPDLSACVIGTGCMERDIQSTFSLYICNFYKNSTKEIETNYNMDNSEVKWYTNASTPSGSGRYVSVKSEDKTIFWDVKEEKRLNGIPGSVKEETVRKEYVEDIGFETGYINSFWWKLDDNRVIGVPYKAGVDSALELTLGDFEIVEVNIKNRTGKILFKIPD